VRLHSVCEGDDDTKKTDLQPSMESAAGDRKSVKHTYMIVRSIVEQKILSMDDRFELACDRARHARRHSASGVSRLLLSMTKINRSECLCHGVCVQVSQL